MSGKSHYFIASAVIVLASSALSVLAYPTGAPVGACESMTPLHGPSGQTSVSPYRVQASSATYSPGSQIKVTISGSNNELFKGFLLHAHTYDDAIAGVGAFSSPASSDDWKLLACFGKNDSAVTHIANSNKTSVVVTWVAPKNVTGPVYFSSTIVQKGDTFWIRVNSTKLDYTNDAGRLNSSIGAMLLVSLALNFLTRS